MHNHPKNIIVNLIHRPNHRAPPPKLVCAYSPLNSHITVPGLAFKTNHPCIELKEEDLLRLATEGAQRHFYQVMSHISSH